MKEGGKKVPFLDNMPELIPEAEPFWTAWQRLHATRGWNGNRPQAITYAELLSFTLYQGVYDEADIEDLETIVRTLDEMYLKHQFAKIRKAEQQTAPPDASQAPRRRR